VESSFLGGRQQHGFEVVLQGGDLFVHLFEFGFVCIRKIGPGMYELTMIELDQAQRFGIQIKCVALLIDCLHALEKPAIEKNGVTMRGELGGFDLLHSLQFGVRVRAGHCGKH
jgi:hypothetical protein